MKQPGLLQAGQPEIDLLYNRLAVKSEDFHTDRFHLKHLCALPGRFADFSLAANDFFLDYSRQRLDNEALALLFEAAEATGALEKFREMTRGNLVNTTEKRAALHMATRASESSASKQPLTIDGHDVNAGINRVNAEIRDFVENVHTGRLTGTSGSPFSDAVVVGIGGSYLGCEFVYHAMGPSMDRRIALHFLPNVDIDDFAGIISRVNPEKTLWIIISKSYTTTETMANLNQVLAFLNAEGLSPKDHVVTVTAKGSPGDDPENPVLASFHMFDFIGGRYSVSSAVGGVPLGLAYGWEGFRRFLDGCRCMDTHALSAPVHENIPLTAALISIWNKHFLGYPAQAIIPYASRLSRLAPHIQQLYMESIGKSVSFSGKELRHPAGSIIFGEPGTNAQHSFFQLAHQGPAFPIDFIGVAVPGFSGPQAQSKGVTNHQELWANLLAQARALALGRDNEDPARRFKGNRPCSIIMLNDLEPESIGQLLAFYEARTIFEGFILGINPFDQFGVELGKVMAGDLRREIAARNQDTDHDFSHLDAPDQFYLDMVFKKNIPGK
ncbi:MAG: glucose-6-phosphate isomerase [Desulfobacter sp.]